MSRLGEKELKEKNRPKRLEELTDNPIPYLQTCNRLEIMEFILQLEQKKARLQAALSERYPDMDQNEIEEKSRAIQLSRGYAQIQKESLSRLEAQVQFSMGELIKIEKENEEMAKESTELTEECDAMEKKMIENERRRRQLEYQHKQKAKQDGAVDVSELMGQLYREVRQVMDKEE